MTSRGSWRFLCLWFPQSASCLLSCQSSIRDDTTCQQKPSSSSWFCVCVCFLLAESFFPKWFTCCFVMFLSGVTDWRMFTLVGHPSTTRCRSFAHAARPPKKTASLQACEHSEMFGINHSIWSHEARWRRLGWPPSAVNIWAKCQDA